MGVINTTPDSFSDGGVHLEMSNAVESAVEMLESGADIIDIGGESTRPGSEETPIEMELSRVLPVIESIRQRYPEAVISIDTRRAAVAQKALEAGASIINDVSGFRDDPPMIDLLVKTRAAAIIMHMLGKPKNMQKNITYKDFPGDIYDFLQERVVALESAGVSANKIVIDPGIGFGKTFDQNLIIINRLKSLAPIGKPILIGASRKSFLGEIIGEPIPARRDLASAAVAVASVMNGAAIIRAHDVKMTVQAVKVANAILRERTQA